MASSKSCITKITSGSTQKGGSSSSDRESSPSSGSVFVGSQTEIPQCTSKWNESHLSSLQIVSMQSRAYTPKEILSSVVDEIIERRVVKVKEHLMNYMPAGLKAIDFDDFYAINHDSCLSILYNANRRQMPSFKVEPLPDYAEEAWCES